MSNTKSTKRALLSSVMAMLICVAMLIGTTFAWFTDSASTAVNKIQAGTLDIELQYQKADGTWEDAEGKTLNFKKAVGHESEALLWEPGCTYELPAVKIINQGNLALKYKVVISATSGDTKLAEVLDVYLNGVATNNTLKEALTSTDPDGFAHGKIGANSESDELVIALHMQESAGNEYQGKALEDLSITIVATQVAGVETDSFNDIYDKDAEYPEVVATAADFEAALDNPDVTEIIVASDITFDWGGNSYGNSNALKMQDKVISGATGNEVVTFKGYGSANTIKDVTISNINVVDETVGDSTGWEHAYLEFENLTATDVKFVNAPQLNGTCILTNCTFTGTADKYAAWINSGNITLKNCMFNGIRSLKIHEAYGSDVVSVVVDGCTFNTTGKPGVVIGDLDATTSITIKNSTFNNCHAGDQNKYIYESDTDVTTFNFTEIGNTVNNG